MLCPIYANPSLIADSKAALVSVLGEEGAADVMLKNPGEALLSRLPVLLSLTFSLPLEPLSFSRLPLEPLSLLPWERRERRT